MAGGKTIEKKKGRALRLEPTVKQAVAWDAWWAPTIDDVVYGGAAGGGKSWWLSEAIMVSALRYPGTRYFIGRKELKTLMQTTFVTMTQKVFVHHKLEQGKHWTFNANRNELYFYNGSQINFLHLGYQPNDPLFDRFGSHEYTQGGIDEASECPFKAYDVLKSRIGRHLNKELGIKSKLALTLNPSQDWPYRIFYDPYKKAGRESNIKHPLVSIRGMVDGEAIDRTFVFIEALYSDNPFVADEYKRNLATITDPVLKHRLMMADWEFSSAQDVLFDAATIADLFTNKVKRGTDKYLTVDVARSADDIVLTHWRGWDAYLVKVIHTKGGMVPIHQTADEVRSALIAHNIPREHVLIDQDGVGGGVFDLVPGCIGFSGGSAPFGVVGEKETREKYENLKTQCMYHLADKARNRQVAVSDPNVEVRELLAADLQQFKRRDSDKDGKLKVVKKEEIKQALGRSPDVGDTLLMRSYFDLRLREEAIGQGGTMSVYIPE